MSKRKSLIWLLTAVLACVAIVGWRRSITTAETVFRLNFTSKDFPVDETQFYHGLFKTQLAPVAIDESGNFHVIAFKRDEGAHGVWKVIKGDAKGKIVGVFPLRRKDGRPILGCDHFSVSPSGKHWWTVRKPFEDRHKLNKSLWQNWIVTFYDNTGKPLQEWEHPSDVGEGLLQAADENTAYLADEGSISRNEVWVYKADQNRASVKRFLGQPLRSNGQFWSLIHNLPPKKPLHYTASVTQLNKKLQKVYIFHTSEPVTIFWHDMKAGLFVFNYSKGGDATVFDQAKTVYRVDAKGVVHKLFATSEVIKTRPNQRFVTGQPLKADAKFVWLEVQYFKNNNPTEYQIVKVPIS